jgi:hypothetical protein
MIELLLPPLLILLVTGPGAAALYIVLLKKKDQRGLALLLAGLAAAAVGLGVWMTYSFGNFFPGAGFFTCLFTPVMALVTLLVFRFEAKGVYRAIGDETVWRRWYLAGSLVLPLLQLAAPLAGFFYEQSCDGLSRRTAVPLIAALEAYKADHGSYFPAEGESSASYGGLEHLVPGYLASLPRPGCQAPALVGGENKEADWSLFVCSSSAGKEVLLLVPMIGTDTKQVYNLGTGNWGRGSAFEGYCSNLR